MLKSSLQLFALFLLSCACGCEQQTQYKILTTVFTGVPSMEELYADAVPEEKIKEPALDVQSEKRLFQHPLWAAQQCTACHKSAPEEKQEEHGRGTGEQLQLYCADTRTADLLVPKKKLCIKCHLDKTARRAIRDRLWLHNPVARGDCLACHAAHESENYAHLRQPPGTICDSCHESSQLLGDCLEKTNGAKKQQSCLGCHNTHMGRNSLMLKQEYKEMKIPAGPVPEPVEFQQAPVREM